MSTPRKALSALVCVVVAFALGFVARLPALMERLDPRVHEARYDLRLPVAPQRAADWGTANAEPVH